MSAATDKVGGPSGGKTPLDDLLRKVPPFQLNPGRHWLTTSPNPRSPSTGYDAGQRGWRVHAVDWTERDNEYHRANGYTRSRKPALCGLRPAHGWGMDLFIDEECARCAAAVEKLEAQEPRHV